LALPFLTKSFVPLAFIIPLAIALGIIGHKLATKDSVIIDDETIKIDDLSISKLSFSDYFRNDYGIFMIRLEFLLENGTIHTIDYKSFGSNGNKFESFFIKLKAIKEENKKQAQVRNR